MINLVMHMKTNHFFCLCRPDQVKYYLMLAECHRRAADYKEAIAVYKTTSSLFPQESSCLRSLIKLCDDLGMEEERKVNQAKLDKIAKVRNL